MNFLIKDPKIDQKSLTVTLVVVSFVLSIVSLIASHYFLSCLPASVLSITLFSLCMLFYRLRKLDSFSIDLKQGKIDAKDEESKVG